MALTIPPELVAALQELAERRQVPAEQLLRAAIEEYLQLEKDLDEELAEWQVGGDELHAAGDEGQALGERDDDS